MGRGKQNLAFVSKNAFPFFLCIIKDPLNFLFQFKIRFSGIAELQIRTGITLTDQFVIELGKNKLENLLKRIHTSAGKHFIFHFLDKGAERTFLLADSINLFQIFISEFFVDNIAELF